MQLNPNRTLIPSLYNMPFFVIPVPEKSIAVTRVHVHKWRLVQHNTYYPSQITFFCSVGVLVSAIGTRDSNFAYFSCKEL